MTAQEWRDVARRCFSRRLGLLLGAAYVVWLYLTSSDLGYARDEGFYFYASSRYEAWFRLLLARPERALEPAVLDYHWSVNHEHPAFIKSLFALSHATLYERWGVFAEPGTAYRFVGWLSAGLLLAVVYAWGRRQFGVLGAVVASLTLALMPRLFFHAHLSCFDVPVALMWLVTAFAYSRALADERWRWPILTGLLYGLLLNTKHNSWLLPPVLLFHFVLTRGYRVRRGSWLSGPSKALLCMLLLGPLVCYATWPWIWRDTWPRWLEYVRFHLGHEYYNMEFLGRTYHKPPMPLLYAWVMTLATVPLTSLVLALVGATHSLANILRERSLLLVGNLRFGATRAHGARVCEVSHDTSTHVLWGLCLLASYAPWLSSGTPIFGGTKHWLTAYPFLALFSGIGFLRFRAAFERWLPAPRWRVSGALGLAATSLAPSLSMTVNSHPYGLSAYTPLVGGAPGAASLGLNRGFWGYTTGALADYINEAAPGGATVYLHDTARQSFVMLQRDGRIRHDIEASLDIASSDLALYHHELHMERVEYQIWVDYGTLTPAALGVFQGVPVVWAYRRPAAVAEAAQ